MRSNTAINRGHCMVCAKNVGPRTKAIQCVKCDGWIHILCSDIDAPLYEALKKCPSTYVSISCVKCRSDTSRSSPVFSPEPDPQLSTASSDLEAPVPGPAPAPVPAPVPMVISAQILPPAETYAQVTRKKLRARRQVEKAPQIASHSSTDLPTCSQQTGVASHSTPPHVNTQTRPTRNTSNGISTTSRDQCIIVANLPEGDEAMTPQAKLDADLTHLRQALELIFTVDEIDAARTLKVISAFRLGKPSTNPVRPRPLKVVLNNVDSAKAVLHRAHRLKGNGVRILRDLSPEDRAKLRTALDELRDRRAAGELDLVIRDFRVVRRRPRVRWSPLFPDLGHQELSVLNLVPPQ